MIKFDEATMSPEISHRVLSSRVVRRTLAKLEEAREFVAEVEARYRDMEGALSGLGDHNAEARRWERWLDLARAEVHETEARLVRAVLATGPGVPTYDRHPECRPHPPRGLTIDGRIFVVVPDPNHDSDGDGAASSRVMLLVEMDAADVVLVEG